MSTISAIIFISNLILIVSGEPSLLTLHPTFLPAKLATENFILAQDLLPKPYQFGYNIADGLGMKQHRQEISDSSGTVKGSYGYVDASGIKRSVEYTADKDGYKAIVRSNEPGITRQSSANTLFVVETPSPSAIIQESKPLVLNSL